MKISQSREFFRSLLDPLSISGRQRSEVFDLAELIDDLREDHEAQFKRHNIDFKIKKPDGPVRIRAVKGMVVQILENLISNSVYWMQMRAARESRYVPAILIRLETYPVTLYFSDNGRGVAKENQERVFRAFWSLKEKTKRRGLGLFYRKRMRNLSWRTPRALGSCRPGDKAFTRIRS